MSLYTQRLYLCIMYKYGAIAAENGAARVLRKLLKRWKIVNVIVIVSKHNLPPEMLSHWHEPTVGNIQ